MITRRAFHSGLLSVLAALCAPRLGLAGPPASLGRQYLNRLTFGATKDGTKHLGSGPIKPLDSPIAH